MLSRHASRLSAALSLRTCRVRGTGGGGPRASRALSYLCGSVTKQFHWATRKEKIRFPSALSISSSAFPIRWSQPRHAAPLFRLVYVAPRAAFLSRAGKKAAAPQGSCCFSRSGGHTFRVVLRTRLAGAPRQSASKPSSGCSAGAPLVPGRTSHQERNSSVCALPTCCCPSRWPCLR